MRVLRIGDELVDARNLLADRPGGDQPQHPRHPDRVVGAVGLGVGNAEDGERRGRGFRIPHRFHRRDLHLLVFGRGVAALVAENDDGQGGGEAEAAATVIERLAMATWRPRSRYQAETASTKTEPVT